MRYWRRWWGEPHPIAMALMAVGMCGFVVTKLWPSWPETPWQYLSVIGLIVLAVVFAVWSIIDAFRDAIRRDRELNG